MGTEDRRTSPDYTTEPRHFDTSVAANPDGGWLATVNVGDGASLSKWFEQKEEAERYGDELAAWLATRQEES